MAILDCTLEELVFVEKPKTHDFIDKTGQTFCRLTVIGYAGKNNHRQTVWYCKCFCGNITKVVSGALASGRTQSCGCLKRGKTKHGKSKSKEYRSYHAIIARCFNPQNSSFRDYGGRGIKCLFKNFEDFLAEVGDAPSPMHSIDRINNDGHYQPGNVRWATPKEQNRNTRVVTRLTCDGQTRTTPEWEERFDLPKKLLRDRKRLGWCDDCAIKTPPKCQPKPCDKHDCKSNKSTRYLTINRETLSVTQWAKKVGLPPGIVSNRLSRGWCPTHAIKIFPSKERIKKPKDCFDCNNHLPTSYSNCKSI